MSKISDIKLKVCGMRDNIGEVAALQPDFMGFIFYDKSPRYVDDSIRKQLEQLPDQIQKVGVFVNSPLDVVVEKSRHYQLDYIQLHGDESVEYCKTLKYEGLKLIKVFSGNAELSSQALSAYAPFIEFYLFDTRTDKYGGTGHKFDWSKLKKLDLQKPIFISGGVDLENVEEIEHLGDLNIHAIDVNSKFEKAPGLKDIELLKQLKSKMQSQSSVSNN